MIDSTVVVEPVVDVCEVFAKSQELQDELFVLEAECRNRVLEELFEGSLLRPLACPDLIQKPVVDPDVETTAYRSVFGVEPITEPGIKIEGV